MRIVFIFFSLLILAGCSQDQKEELITEDELVLTDQWVRPGVKDRNTAAFIKIQNNTNENDTLVSAGSSSAKVVEIHETFSRENDMKGMRKVDNIIIPAKSTVELKPGGFHVMLIGLNNDLVAGTEVKIELNFKKSGVKAFTAKVGEE